MVININRNSLRLGIILIALFGGAFVLLKVVPVDGATLTAPRDYLNRQKADLSASDGVQHELFFTAVTGISNGKVKLTFPEGDDGKWCRTNGVDLVVTGIANPTGATESATILPGTLGGSCTAGTGPGSFDQIVVTFSGDISAGKYGVRIANGSTGKLGTASAAANDIKVTLQTTNGSDTVQDATVFALSLISSPHDQLTVTALVDVTLTVEVSSNAVNLNTLSTSTINKGLITSRVSTSAAGGYISLVKYDHTLTSTPNTIPDVADSTIVAGTSEYGASSSDSGNTIAAWSPASCVTGTAESNATPLSTTFKDFASNTIATTSEETSLCFMASIAATQQPGTYTSTATVVTTARF